MLDEAVAKVETSVMPDEYIKDEAQAISIINKINKLREKLDEVE